MSSPVQLDRLKKTLEPLERYLETLDRLNYLGRARRELTHGGDLTRLQDTVRGRPPSIGSEHLQAIFREPESALSAFQDRVSEIGMPRALRQLKHEPVSFGDLVGPRRTAALHRSWRAVQSLADRTLRRHREFADAPEELSIALSIRDETLRLRSSLKELEPRLPELLSDVAKASDGLRLENYGDALSQTQHQLIKQARETEKRLRPLRGPAEQLSALAQRHQTSVPKLLAAAKRTSKLKRHLRPPGGKIPAEDLRQALDLARRLSNLKAQLPRHLLRRLPVPQLLVVRAAARVASVALRQAQAI